MNANQVFCAAVELDAARLQYFTTTDAVVQEYGGNIDKHIGDAVMAVFGAPVAQCRELGV